MRRCIQALLVQEAARRELRALAMACFRDQGRQRQATLGTAPDGKSLTSSWPEASKTLQKLGVTGLHMDQPIGLIPYSGLSITTQAR